MKPEKTTDYDNEREDPAENNQKYNQMCLVTSNSLLLFVWLKKVHSQRAFAM